MATVQTSYFQVVVNVTTGTPQSSLDAGRSSLSSQVNAFLSPLPAHSILDVQTRETFMTAGNSQYVLLTADVTFRQ